MDWEKQDNELRRLLEGDAFLPEGETWNGQESWQKLHQKMQPVKRKIAPVWLRLSAAACMAGVLGGGFWYFQTPGSFSKPGESLVTGEKITPKVPEMNPENLKEQPGPEILPASTTEMDKTVHAATGPKQPGNQNSFTKAGVQLPETNTILTREEIKTPKDSPEPGPALATIEKQPETEVESGIQPVPAAIVPDALAMVPAPVKKSKPRVIHYNQLGGMQSTPPPVFVQTKKAFPDWDGLVVQSAQTHVEQPFQLKIDISQAPKKSL